MNNQTNQTATAPTTAARVPILKMTDKEMNDLRSAEDTYGLYRDTRLAKCYYLKSCLGYSIARSLEIVDNAIARREEMDAMDSRTEAQKQEEDDSEFAALSSEADKERGDFCTEQLAYRDVDYREIPDDLSEAWATGEGM